MRVALLTHNAPAGDAIGNQLAEKVAFFLERAADVRVFLESARALHPILRPHAHVVRAGVPTEEAWQFLAAADLVIAEYGHFYPLLGLLPLLAGGRPRLLLDYHGVTPAELWDLGNREAVEAGARWRGLVWCADAAIAHSQCTRRELLDASGFPPERVAGMGYVIDRSRFHPGRAGRSLGEQLGLGSASLLLFVGRLAPNKRVPVLIEALARLRDVVPPVHAVLIGDNADVYQVELRRCLERAAALGVAERLHCLGHVDEDRLLDAYRSATALVIPSRHEGFGLPVLEAMACGLPVIAARAAALPESVASAGLTFRPDDAEDLARQVRRVLNDAPTKPHPRSPQPLRVAVVSFRYGTDFVGGAETSLRTIAETLHRTGHAVEVVTTCTRSVTAWANELPEGATTINGVPVHRFRVDPHDQTRHLATVHAVRAANGDVPPDVGQAYFTHSVQSSRLMDALRQRIDQLDAVIVGPYLLGLTWAVARAFPEKTLLLPCFHDEGFARLAATQAAYEGVAGILYHSLEEQELAERDLGMNHPGAVCAGTFLDAEAEADTAAAQEQLAGADRYVVYCGRYSEHKGLPTLIEYARRYHACHPDRFTFVFLGEGEVALPREPWARDLGFVAEACKRGVIAGAAALVLLSRQESLSLVALEAWAQGTPVLADAGCPVLAGQVRRSEGGAVAADFESFAAALDDLWSCPERWRARGRQGRQYVRAHYGSRAAFAERLVTAITDMKTPLAERMRRRGLERAAAFSRSAWRAQFGSLVETVLHAPTRPYRAQVEIQPRMPERTVPLGADTVLIPVRVLNQGTHVVVPEGPARLVLCCRVQGVSAELAAESISLPGLILPGRSVPAAIHVPVPRTAGTYEVTFWSQRATSACSAGILSHKPDAPAKDAAGPSLARQACVPPNYAQPSSIRLVVENSSSRVPAPCCAPLLDLAEAALVKAQRLQRLPDDYTDVTEGCFARWKRWIKRKVLGNFKHAYVDVLSRQQSAVNAQLLAALREVTECCATLDHAVRQLQDQRGQRPREMPLASRGKGGRIRQACPEVPGLPEQAQTGEEAMSLWYAAHLIMYVKLKDNSGGKSRVWENIVLIKAGSEEEAFAKAAQRGKEDEGDDDGTFRWGGKPAQWMFAGVRKLTLCDDPEKRPGDGTEVSYLEMEVESEQAVWKLLEGKAVAVRFKDPFAAGKGRDEAVVQAR